MDNLANNNLASNIPTEERGWEYKQVCVTRVPGYGFGIAVSGGRDNPHFASGDPSIAVSDVLASGPAERMLQVNDRIISVNGISLHNVDYATAVQVLRDSGDTVTLVIKRRTLQNHHGHSASYSGAPLAALGVNPAPAKVTLTKNSKKEDFGIVLGCKLFIKEISSKARDQLLNSNQVLVEGDFVTKINNTNCNDLMSLKEAKKIIDGTKDKLNITVARDFSYNSNISHQTQSSISTTGDDFLTSGHQSYSNQNLYVQPPTRNPNLNQNGGFDDLKDTNGPTSLPDEKSNLAPRGRSRGPLDANMAPMDNGRNNMGSYGRSKSREEPPRPPPPRAEDYYSSRRQIYDEDPIVQKTKQPIPDARFITFHKEGSVGIRLTGGNFVGIFVTAVQPGSPASLQGLQPGDKILKVNDMDMNGVTREEAVLFLLSLQDRIELIVQFCKEEYDNIVASQKGDSFYVKTHFHYENPAKGEMSFRSGDTFHVIDTLYNGVVGCWQVFRIGRNNQEVQKGIIPNKSRAEELATAQFNATKKEMSATESRGSFFKRRRSSNRRSKSLGKEHWDDILFSDTVSKFPAYERVLLKHPGFTRPVILFGPIADVARDKLLKDFPDKFISPQIDNSLDDSNNKTPKTSSNIIRLSAIRDVISTGKHALLDITPNAVERLNYAQMYPIVVFFKAETKIVVKQLRQGLPKSAHKSSKKLLEQCQKLDKVWNHVFSSTITLNDNTDTWYRKVREIIDKQQSGALWMSESKPEESLSDDFLFPMSSLRLSYASSPESDLEHSPGPREPSGLSGNNSVTAGRLTKASSDPSVVMPDSPNDVLPPYQPNYDSRYGFNGSNPNQNLGLDNQTSPPDTPLTKDPTYTLSNPDISTSVDQNMSYNKSSLYGENYQKTEYGKMDTRNDFGPPNGREYNSQERRNEFNGNQQHKRQGSSVLGPYSHSKAHSIGDQPTPKENLYGTAPDLPPRVDRGAKPMGLLTTTNKIPNGRSAHERLFGTKANPDGTDQNANNENGGFNNKVSSLDRSQNSKSDSLSSYDSFNKQQSNPRIGPNAHDDLKTTLSKIDPVLGTNQNSPSKYNSNQRGWDQQNSHRHGSKMDLKYGLPPGQEHNLEGSPRNSREMDKEGSPMDAMTPRGSVERDMYRYPRSPAKQGLPRETKTDYGKYSRNNNVAPPEYTRSSHQDLRESQLSIHQGSPIRSPPMHMNGYQDAPQHPQNGNGGYKPVPPPKPKNYKPPYGKGGYPGEGMVQPPVYQHNKSHSNPVDQRNQLGNMSQHNYYYNTPPHTGYNTGYQGHYDMAPPYQESPRRHPSISYASRSEITSISNMHQHENPYSMDHHSQDILDSRPPVVDLQGSREQRGSAFELYRKPIGHNMRVHQPDCYGSQPNINQPLTNSPKHKTKLTKTQSFKEKKSDGFSTPKFLRKLSFRRNKNKDKESKDLSKEESTPKMTKKMQQQNDMNSRSNEPKMVMFSDLNQSENESMYSDRKSLYLPKNTKIYQDRESLYSERQLYQNKECIYQDRDALYQDKLKIYQDRESLYQERLKLYPDKSSIYQDRITVMQEKQRMYDRNYSDKKMLYQDLKQAKEEADVLNQNKKIYQDFREVKEEVTRVTLSRQNSLRERKIYQDFREVKEEAARVSLSRQNSLRKNMVYQDFKEVKEEQVRAQLQRNNSVREKMYQSFREAKRTPENNRLYQSLRQVRHDIHNLQDNQKIYDDFLRLRTEVKKLQSPTATTVDQNKNPEETTDKQLYQDFKKLKLEVEKLKNPVDTVHDLKNFTKASKRDITSAYVSDTGAKLTNQYWGVTLEIPEGAIPKGESREIYFVVSDPRQCQNGNAPPLDLENGETMLSPLVMCGPQGTEFLKPVILNIPHYANTLPSLAISLKATDSEQELNTDWDNILLPSNHAANSVAVKVDHF